VNVLKPHLQTTIWTLLGAGASQREIERITGIDRKTIRGYQKRFAAAAANSPGVSTDLEGQIPPPRPPTPMGGLLTLVKKSHRDLAPADHHVITEEVGDALWYLVNVSVHYGASLQEVGVAAMTELQRRLNITRKVEGELTFEEFDRHTRIALIGVDACRLCWIARLHLASPPICDRAQVLRKPVHGGLSVNSLRDREHLYPPSLPLNCPQE